MTVNCAALQTDFYKTGHKSFLNKEIAFMNSNYTSRSGKHSNTGGDKVAWVGLQYYIMDYLIDEWNHTFFNLPKEHALRNIKRICDNCLDLDYNVDHFSELHDLGYLPLEIRSLPEGTLVPYGVAPVTFENTIAGFDWAVNYQETVLSSELWGINTSCTTAIEFFKNIREAFEVCGAPKELIPFMGHDFSFRGMFGRHAAASSGFGFLASGFAGTDTIPAILFAEKYYGADVETELVGVSVKANEHSVVTSDIAIVAAGMTHLSDDDAKFEAELQFVERYLRENPTGIVSHVSDSYDFYRFIEEGLPRLKPLIMSRDGTFVVRPDTGNPVDILCGTVELYYFNEDDTLDDVKRCMEEILYNEVVENTPYGEAGVRTHTGYASFNNSVYKVTIGIDWTHQDHIDYYIEDTILTSFEEVELTVEQKGLVQVEEELFGSTLTPEGYKLIDSRIGSIYGDSITLAYQNEIIRLLLRKGICPTTVYGIGSFSMQYVTRDTHGSAVKATNVTKHDGTEVPVSKAPKTDIGKKSARGLTMVIRDDNGELIQIDNVTREEYNSDKNLRKTVFKDGVITKRTTLRQIRELVESQL